MRTRGVILSGKVVTQRGHVEREIPGDYFTEKLYACAVFRQYGAKTGKKRIPSPARYLRMNSDSKATYPSEGEGFPLPIPSLRKRNREFKSFPPPIAKKRGRSNFKPQKLCRPLLKPSNARFNCTKFSGGKEAKDMNFDENFPWEEQSESQERSEPPARQFPGSGPLRPISSTSRGEQNSEKATSLVVRKRKSFYGGLVPSRRRRVSSRHR
eukprot:452101-Amorphochlora_amoeboformis.AAC.1